MRRFTEQVREAAFGSSLSTLGEAQRGGAKRHPERSSNPSFSSTTAAPAKRHLQSIACSLNLSSSLLSSSPSLPPTRQVKQGTGLIPATFIPTSNARNELMLKEVREREKEIGREKDIDGSPFFLPTACLFVDEKKKKKKTQKPQN